MLYPLVPQIPQYQLCGDYRSELSRDGDGGIMGRETQIPAESASRRISIETAIVLVISAVFAYSEGCQGIMSHE